MILRDFFDLDFRKKSQKSPLFTPSPKKDQKIQKTEALLGFLLIDGSFATVTGTLSCSTALGCTFSIIIRRLGVSLGLFWSMVVEMVPVKGGIGTIYLKDHPRYRK